MIPRNTKGGVRALRQRIDDDGTAAMIAMVDGAANIHDAAARIGCSVHSLRRYAHASQALWAGLHALGLIGLGKGCPGRPRQRKKKGTI